MSATRPANILHLRDTYEIGGPGKTILETYNAIDATRFRLHLGTFLGARQDESTPFLKAARAIGMPVHVIRGRHRLDPTVVWRLADVVRKHQIDIIEAHEVSSDVISYLASFLTSAVIINTSHGWIGHSRKDRLLIALDKWVLGKFELVIAVSNKLHADLIAAGVPKERLELLHNAIVLSRYQRNDKKGFTAGLVGQTDGPLLVSVGRLSAEKGHADLVDALALVAQRGYRFTAVFAGDGPERTALTERIQAKGLAEQVRLPGYVSEPWHILNEADLTILPSHTEGLPNAALEALTMGVPVLATRVGGTPEVITHEDTGVLVEPRRPAEMADAIVDFLEHRPRWQQMALRGKTMVEQHFDFAARTRRLEQIYAGLLEARRS